jgi:hypothetical protein
LSRDGSKNGPTNIGSGYDQLLHKSTAKKSDKNTHVTVVTVIVNSKYGHIKCSKVPYVRSRMQSHSQMMLGGGILRESDATAPSQKSQTVKEKRTKRKDCKSDNNMINEWLCGKQNVYANTGNSALLPTPLRDENMSRIEVLNVSNECNRLVAGVTDITRDKLSSQHMLNNQLNTVARCDGSSQTVPTLKCDKRIQTTEMFNVGCCNDKEKDETKEKRVSDKIIPEKKGINKLLSSRGTLTVGPLAYCCLDDVPRRNIINATHLVNVFTSGLERKDRRTLRGNIIAILNNAYKQAKCGGHLVFNLYLKEYDIMPEYIIQGAEINIRCTKTKQIEEATRVLHEEIRSSNIKDLKDKYDELKESWVSIVNTIRRFLNIRMEKREQTSIMNKIMTLTYKVRLGTIYMQLQRHERKANKSICNTEHLCGTKRVWVTNNEGKVAAGNPVVKKYTCCKNHYIPTVADYMNPRGTMSWELGHIENVNIALKAISAQEKIDYNSNKDYWSIEEWNDFLKDFSSKHSIPSLKPTKALQEEFEKDWQRMMYGMRWKAIIENMPGKEKEENRINIPFECPFVKLPEPLDKQTEFTMDKNKKKIMKDVMKHTVGTTDNTWKSLKDFMKREKMELIGTDKTKRNILMKKDKVVEMGERFLKNNKDYKLLKESKAKNIMKEANEIMKKIISESNIGKRDASKLTCKYARGAQVQFLIKDHKDKDEEGNFPVRPIASIHNTPVDKLDFILQYILVQAAKLVPTNLLNCEEALKKLDEINLMNVDEGKKRAIMSLDVQSLYPSIPTNKGVDEVMKFITEHSMDIDTMCISKQTIKTALSYVCNNYEVEFNGCTYLQTKGIPMGARFAPPFAIIYMAAIEKIATDELCKRGYHIEYYTRYIDDTLMVVHIDKNLTIDSNEVLEVFNGVANEIQFTIECPKEDERMPFLDTELYLEENKIKYCWYMKELHSGNLMRTDAFAPMNMKENFIVNAFCRVFARCNNTKDTESSINKMFKLLEKNNYDPMLITKGLKRAVHKHNNKKERKEWNKDEAIFKMQYESDLVNKNTKSTLSGMGIKLVNKKFIRLNSLNPKNNNHQSMCTCNVCKMVGDKFTCKSRHVVYKYTCLGCQDSYIGKTINSIDERHKQHRSAVIKNDTNKSALAEHLSKCCYAFQHDMNAYNLSILERCKDNVDTIIREAWWINHLNPKMNRKMELAYKYY